MKFLLGLTLAFSVATLVAVISPGQAQQGAPMTPYRPLPAYERVWRTWIEKPTEPALSIPEPRYPEVYEYLFWYINKAKKKDVTFIDIGCAVGDYLKVVKRVSTKPINSIGIDPVDWPGRGLYTKFLQVGIAREAKEGVKFNLYGSSDLGTSSLKRLKKENITHNQQEQDQKFYHPAAVEEPHGRLTTRTIPLSQVIKDEHLTDYIDLIKTNAPGTDLEVLMSAGDSLKKVLFIQLESILSENPNQLLYEDQTTFTQDRAALEAQGFKVFNIAKFRVSPGGDVLFVNTKLFKQIAARDNIFSSSKK